MPVFELRAKDPYDISQLKSLEYERALTPEQKITRHVVLGLAQLGVDILNPHITWTNENTDEELELHTVGNVVINPINTSAVSVNAADLWIVMEPSYLPVYDERRRQITYALSSGVKRLVDAAHSRVRAAYPTVDVEFDHNGRKSGVARDPLGNTVQQWGFYGC